MQISEKDFVKEMDPAGQYYDNYNKELCSSQELIGHPIEEKVYDDIQDLFQTNIFHIDNLLSSMLVFLLPKKNRFPASFLQPFRRSAYKLISV